MPKALPQATHARKEMKIIPFEPAANPPGTRPTPRPSPEIKPRDDFEDFLKRSERKLLPRDKIGLENLLANESAQPGDLSQAAALITSLISQLGQTCPSELERIHNVEGILYF
ncbi:MAG: hypothetical protein LBE27_05610 [Deltaproteobacteria bacterium]|jgi:hypothetical protein|nr:hypothetical protein [Deltaproteobacteria bacterium]